MKASRVLAIVLFFCGIIACGDSVGGALRDAANMLEDGTAQAADEDVLTLDCDQMTTRTVNGNATKFWYASANSASIDATTVPSVLLCGLVPGADQPDPLACGQNQTCSGEFPAAWLDAENCVTGPLEHLIGNTGPWLVGTAHVKQGSLSVFCGWESENGYGGHYAEVRVRLR